MFVKHLITFQNIVTLSQISIKFPFDSRIHVIETFNILLENKVKNILQYFINICMKRINIFFMQHEAFKLLSFQSFKNKYNIKLN